MNLRDTATFRYVMWCKFFMVICVWGMVPLLIPTQHLPFLGLQLSAMQIVYMRIWGIVVLLDSVVYFYMYKHPHEALTKYLLLFGIADNGGMGTILLFFTPVFHLPWGIWINIPFQLFFGYWFLRFYHEGGFQS